MPLSNEALQQAKAHATRGMAALNRADGQEASEAFQAAIDQGWPGPDVWVALSQARRLLGDTAGRAAALDAALEIDPGNVRARLYRAETALGAGEPDRAASLYETALADAARAPNTPEMQTLLQQAQAFLAAREQRAKLVGQFADMALGSAPDDAEFEQSLALLFGETQPYWPQPTRYFYPGLPTRQFYPREAFPWTASLEAQTDIIRDELERLIAEDAPGFGPYVEGSGREGEMSHPLKNNPDWSAFYLIKQGQRIEENIARCPATMAAIDALGEDALPAPAPSVLFSRLDAGTRIPPHHGMLNTRLICHLPLILPEGCGFRVGNDVRPWKLGEMFLFDDTIEHEAWNESDQTRYVLIFELWRPELDARQRALVSRLFEAGKTAPG